MTYSTEQDAADLLALSQLPEPLRLAAMLEKTMQWPLHGKAADELRRLHEANQELLEALEKITHYAECQVVAFASGTPYLDMTLFPRLCVEARAAIAKHGGAA